MAADVQFITGRAGTGKTAAVYAALKKNEQNGTRSLLIVPDRATFETERALSRTLGCGMLHTSVLSFTRLARRVMDETGGACASLSAQGRLMLIRRILDEKHSSLTAFKRVGRFKGFSAECDEIVLKCKRFSITPDQLASADGLPAQLREKLADFALVYSRLNELTDGRYMDGEDLINSLVDRLPQSSFAGLDVFIDAPDMLNEQSLRIIEALFKSSRRVVLTFRADPAASWPDRALFEPELASFERLIEAAKRLGCKRELLQLDKNLRQTDAALSHLEANLFASSRKKFNAAAKNIELHSSASRLCEVQEAACAIRDALRDGLRCREIAVAASDLSGYAETISRVFKQYGIPFFMDAKHPVAAHPLAELVLASLGCVQRGFRSEDFIRVMKTGLTAITDEQAERLENYILKYGLIGNRLIKPEPSLLNHDDVPDFEELERARLAVAEPLVMLREQLAPDGDRSAPVRVKALVAYLTALGVEERLREQFELLKNDPETLAYALETRQIYDALTELLDQVYVILGDAPIGLEKFASIIEEGLNACEVGTIPTTLDQVLVGDISSIHVPSMRFLLILGANEGQLPRKREDNMIINDRELALMRRAGLNAWETTESMNRAENLRLYSIISKATERLRVSYCSELSSSEASPSALVRAIGGCFPHCQRSSGNLAPALWGSDEAAFEALAEGLREYIDAGEESDSLAPLYARFSDAPAYTDALSTLDSMLFNDDSPAPLGQDAAMRLYGRRASGSATRLEIFNECPFRYFMSYGLVLNEREVHRQLSTDFGRLIHAALELLMKKLIDERADYASITKEQLEKRLDALLPELISSYKNGLLLESALLRAQLAETRQALLDSALAIVNQIALGEFRPYASELGFGRKDDALPPLTIEGANGTRFLIRGVIDRLDTAFSGGRSSFRVIDYKTYDMSFDYSELAAGIQLQLPLYTAAVLSALQAAHGLSTRLEAGGMYYMHVHSPSLDEKQEEKSTLEIMKKHKLAGLTLRDESVLYANERDIGRFSAVLQGVRSDKASDIGLSGSGLVTDEELSRTLSSALNTASRTLDAIMQGRAEISPCKTRSRTACERCKFGSICRFEPASGGKYRRIRSLSADDFFKRSRR